MVGKNDFRYGNSRGSVFGERIHSALLIPSGFPILHLFVPQSRKELALAGVYSGELRPLRFILPPFLNETLLEDFEL